MTPWRNRTRHLLVPAIVKSGGVRADLGCGKVVSTMLLATRLLPDSLIHPADKNLHPQTHPPSLTPLKYPIEGLKVQSE